MAGHSCKRCVNSWEQEIDNMANAPSDISQDTHVKDETIIAKDREVLRHLAGRVAELAARDIEQEKKQYTSLMMVKSQSMKRS